MRQFCILAFVLAISTGLAVRAEEPAVSGYSDYNGFRLELESIGSVEVRKIWNHWGGRVSKRDIFVLRVGTDKMDDKPAVLVVGGLDSSADCRFGGGNAARSATRSGGGGKAGGSGDARTHHLLFHSACGPGHVRGVLSIARSGHGFETTVPWTKTETGRLMRTGRTIWTGTVGLRGCAFAIEPAITSAIRTTSGS